ncbi:MAG: efflux RND transporter periplasmic adaptor subunit [Spirochaetaceae bacterium]|nr:efflux RND transporter periplasmic adaptor subunit [Spirochaetaceae bacterium]
MTRPRHLPRTASALVAALAALTAGCFLLPQEEEILAPPLVEPPEISYRTMVVELDTIERRVVVGGAIVYPTQIALQFGERSGRLKEVLVRLGDDVTAGQVLATLDTDTLRLDVERQRIRVRRAELGMERTAALGADRFQQEMAGLDVQLERLALDQLETELAKSTLRSPIDGEVVFVTRVFPGEPIGARQTVVQVADPRDLLFAYRGQRDDEFSLGREVTINLRGDTYPGEVVMTPRNAPLDAPDEMRDVVLVRVDAPPEALTRGQTGTASMVTDRREDVIVLPSDAVQTYVNRRFVFVLEDDLRIERSVEVGLSTSTQVEIVDGLSVGETVVLR